MKRLSRSFYIREDVVGLSRELLGKVLVSEVNGQYTAGMIVETEAYRAPEDRGSHAFDNRRTKRTEPMFARGGTAYVYLIYGMYHLFNVVTGPEETAHAILIRGLEPLEGLEIMKERRGLAEIRRNLTAGPGLLSQALGIQKHLSGMDMLAKNPIVYVEDRGIKVREEEITSSPRVGMNFQGPWAKIPWRFRIKNNTWTSPAK